MKNAMRILGVFTITVIIAFLFLTCDDSSDESEVESVVIKDGLRFELNSAKNAYTVFGNYDAMKSTNIPTSIGNIPVTQIGAHAFFDYSSLTSVSIPSSVKGIGDSAFQNCTNLISIQIPDSVTSIGNGAFINCSLLSTIVLPNGLTTISDNTFQNCYGLVSVTIPNGVTKIGNNAFQNDNLLTIIGIPESVLYVGIGAFASWSDSQIICTRYLNQSQTDNAWGSNWRSGSSAELKTHSYSSAYVTISEPTCLTSGREVMSCNNNGCNVYSNTRNISALGHDITTWTTATCTTGGNETKTCNRINCNFSETKTVSALGHSFPAVWTKIINPTETTDGEETANCQRAGCSFVENRTAYATGTAGLEYNVFQNMYQEMAYACSVDIKETVTSSNIHIPDYHLYNGEYLPVVNIVSNTANISVTNIRISNNMGNYGMIPVSGFTFNSFNNLTSISADANNSNYASESGVLYSKNKTEIIYVPNQISDSFTIPNSVTSIGNGAFSRSTKLTNITIPNSVTSIGSQVFEDCTNLTSITIPDSVTSIGGNAFSGCTGLKSIIIPNSVTRIEFGTFSDCTGLTNINIPKNVTFISSGAFFRCESLISINVDINNPNYESQNGILFNKGRTRLIMVPSSVIGESFTIPDGVTAIDENVFYYCTNLTNIIIPNSVTSIGWQAFDYNKISSIIIHATIPPSFIGVSWGFSFNGQIYVPAASLNVYKTANIWSDHADKIFPIE